MHPIVILGATATGKSALAVAVARRLGGRIISADSVQVYRGRDIGSCKPSRQVRDHVPHELIDVADPEEPFSAGDFARAAAAAIASCRRDGVTPIIAGGTGLYIRALLCGIAEMPPRDMGVRRKLYAMARTGPPGALHALLRRGDPESAERIGPNDLQRIVRALEVLELTGKPLSGHIRARSFRPDALVALKVGLTMAREKLYRRIEERVERIFQTGIVEEVRGLIARGVPSDCNALKALGYREVVDSLKGRMDLTDTRECVKRNTRRYARRQICWFRRERDVHWLTVDDEPENLQRLVGKVLELYGRYGGGCKVVPKGRHDGC